MERDATTLPQRVTRCAHANGKVSIFLTAKTPGTSGGARLRVAPSMSAARNSYPDGQYVLVSEAGFYNFDASSFVHEEVARRVAADWWCCWLLYSPSQD